MPEITPRMVAEHVVAHPHFGRDQDLARGWLVMLDALEAGEDPVAALQEFVTRDFLRDNNNGVPLTPEGYA